MHNYIYMYIFARDKTFYNQYIMGLFGNNNENELKSFEQTIERLKSEYASLEDENRAKDAEIERLKKVIEGMGGTEEKPTPAPEVPAEEVPVCVQGADYAPAFEALNVSLNELKEQVLAQKALMDEHKVLLGYRERQDENMRAMHKELEQYKGDFFVKITQPYLKALLDLHSRFTSTYTHFDQLDNTECNWEELYGNLMREFKSAIMALSDRAYNDFGVEYYEPEVGEDFNRKLHQQLQGDSVETNNPELNAKIAKVICGGFVNIDTEKVVRYARVKVYKYAEATPTTETQE